MLARRSPSKLHNFDVIFSFAVEGRSLLEFIIKDVDFTNVGYIYICFYCIKQISILYFRRILSCASVPTSLYSTPVGARPGQGYTRSRGHCGQVTGHSGCEVKVRVFLRHLFTC